jgi:hypothetical protein
MFRLLSADIFVGVVCSAAWLPMPFILITVTSARAADATWRLGHPAVMPKWRGSLNCPKTPWWWMPEFEPERMRLRLGG